MGKASASIQGVGEGALSLAVGGRWHGAADQRPIGYALGGHRLAATVLVFAAEENGVAQLLLGWQISDKG